MKDRQLAIMMLLFITIGLTTFASTANADIYTISNLINKRLSYMKDVAGDKAKNHRVIEDLVQEKKVIEKAIADANSLGIQGETVRHFIQAQMDAAKAIQYRFRADWLSTPEVSWQPRPLDQIREHIGRLSYDIIKQVAARLKVKKPLTDAEKEIFIREIYQKNLSRQDKENIWKALKEVKLK